MIPFTYITTCKGRLAHLQRSLPLVATQPGINCIVVDYDCPDGAADWVKANFPQVKVVHVENTPGFNISRARNLGVAQSQTAWIGLFDADILLAPAFCTSVLPILQPGFHYRADPPTRQTWGSVICQRQDFNRIGGYDEAYAGWGGEDDDFFESLQLIGVKRANFPSALLSEIQHPDTLRSRFHDLDMVQSHRINQFYRRIKTDLMSVMRAPVPETLRRQIHASVRHKILERADSKEFAVHITVNLPDHRVAPPLADSAYATPQVATIERRLKYVLSLKDLTAPQQRRT